MEFSLNNLERDGVVFYCPQFDEKTQQYIPAPVKDYYRREEYDPQKGEYIGITEPNLSDYVCESILCVIADVVRMYDGDINYRLVNRLLESIDTFRSEILLLTLPQDISHLKDVEEQERLVIEESKRMSALFMELMEGKQW